jgi:hypothetical protein
VKLLLVLLLVLPAPSGAPDASSRRELVVPSQGFRGASDSSGRNPTVSGTPSTEGLARTDARAGMASGVTSWPATGAPLQGWATYFDAKAGTAAAGPLLRSGDWRGRVVTVCAGECVTVRLTDWCACGSRHGKPTLIDLARADFARLAPTSQGVVWVTIGRATLPATDAAP